MHIINTIPSVLFSLLLCLPGASAQTLSDALAEGRPLDLHVGVSGQVAEVLVAEGDQVEAGQLLLSLGTATFQARLDAARVKQAQLEYELQLEEEDFERQQELYEEGSLSTVELQLYQLEVRRAQTGLAQAKADAAVAAANLEFSRIYAPAKGRITAVPLVGQRVNTAMGLPVLIKMQPE